MACVPRSLGAPQRYKTVFSDKDTVAYQMVAQKYSPGDDREDEKPSVLAILLADRVKSIVRNIRVGLVLGKPPA